MSWSTANNAVLDEGKRVLINNRDRFEGVRAIGVDEHVWRHTRRGDEYVTVIIDLTGVRDQTGPARLLDMIEGRSKAAFKTWLAQRPTRSICAGTPAPPPRARWPVRRQPAQRAVRLGTLGVGAHVLCHGKGRLRTHAPGTAGPHQARCTGDRQHGLINHSVGSAWRSRSSACCRSIRVQQAGQCQRPLRPAKHRQHHCRGL